MFTSCYILIQHNDKNRRWRNIVFMLLLGCWHRTTFLKMPMYNFFFSQHSSNSHREVVLIQRLYVCYINSSISSQGTKFYIENRNPNHLGSWLMLISRTVSESRRLCCSLEPDLPSRLLTVSLASVVSHALLDVAVVCILWAVSFLGRHHHSTNFL